MVSRGHTLITLTDGVGEVIKSKVVAHQTYDNFVEAMVNFYKENGLNPENETHKSRVFICAVYKGD